MIKGKTGAGAKLLRRIFCGKKIRLFKFLLTKVGKISIIKKCSAEVEYAAEFKKNIFSGKRRLFI